MPAQNLKVDREAQARANTEYYLHTEMTWLSMGACWLCLILGLGFIPFTLTTPKVSYRALVFGAIVALSQGARVASIYNHRSNRLRNAHHNAAEKALQADLFRGFMGAPRLAYGNQVGYGYAEALPPGDSLSPGDEAPYSEEEEFNDYLDSLEEAGEMIGYQIVSVIGEDGKVKTKIVEIEEGLAFDRYLLEPWPGVKPEAIEKAGKPLQIHLKLDVLPSITTVSGGVAVDIPVITRRFVEFAEDPQLISPTEPPKIAIGYDHLTGELYEIPLDSSATGNFVMGGLPRLAGKTTLIYSMLASLMRSHEQIKFAVFDGKAGLSYNFLKEHPYLLFPKEAPFQIARNFEEGTQLVAYLFRIALTRMAMFEKVGASHLDEYNQKTSVTLPWIFVPVDECQAVIDTSPKRNGKHPNEVYFEELGSTLTPLQIWEKLASICNTGGIVLLFASQRVDGNMLPEQLNYKCANRIALKLADPVSSKYLIQQEGANTLLGRGDLLFSHDGSTPVRLQSPSINKDAIETYFEVFR